MSNCILAYPDKSLSAAFGGAGSWQPLLPLTNLRVSELALKARSMSNLTSSTTFDIDLGSVQHIRILSLIQHNASPTATLRIRFSTVSDFATTVHDSGSIPFHVPKYPQGGLPFNHPDFWTGGTVDASFLIDFPKDFYYEITTDYSIQARYIRVDITDTTNPDGYFELSRCFVAPAYQPSTNMNYGASFGRESSTLADTVAGGVTYYDKRKLRRFVNFTTEINESQGSSYPLEMQRILDIHGELFFIWNPEDATMVEKQRSFLCTMKELSPLEYAYVDNNTVGYKLAEVL